MAESSTWQMACSRSALLASLSSSECSSRHIETTRASALEGEKQAHKLLTEAGLHNIVSLDSCNDDLLKRATLMQCPHFNRLAPVMMPHIVRGQSTSERPQSGGDQHQQPAGSAPATASSNGIEHEEVSLAGVGEERVDGHDAVEHEQPRANELPSAVSVDEQQTESVLLSNVSVDGSDTESEEAFTIHDHSPPTVMETTSTQSVRGRSQSSFDRLALKRQRLELETDKEKRSIELETARERSKIELAVERALVRQKLFAAGLSLAEVDRAFHASD